VREVIMKMTAQTSVTLARNVTEPRPPKTEVEFPPPPRAAIPSPFPGWSRMTKIKKTLTSTCSVVTMANNMGCGC
jgi:hypothetical protein